MSVTRKRVVLYHEHDSTRDNLKLATGRLAELFALRDRVAIEAVLRLYGKIDAVIAELTHSNSAAIPTLAFARETHPHAKRILLVEGSALQFAYHALHDGTVQSYYIQPTRPEQLAEMLGLPSVAERRAPDNLVIARQLNVQPPLTGGRRANSSPSLR